MIYVVFFLCFLVRALPRFRLRNVYLSDTYFHLYCADLIRNNGFKIPERVSKVVLNHAYTYPFGYHYFLSLFSYRFRLWLERMSGALFDTGSLFFMYLFLAWAVRYFEEFGSLSRIPLMVAVLFAFSPGLLRIGNSPRAYNGSPRVVGQTLYLLHLLSGFYAYTNKDVFMLTVSLLAGAVLIITSKFGSQVLVFFGIGFVLFFGTYYILVLGGCFILAFLGIRGRSVRIIVGHIRHSVFYAKYLQAVFLYRQVRTFPVYCLVLLYQGWQLFSRFQFWNVSGWFFRERYFLHILITNYPQFCLVVYYVQEFHRMNSLERFFVVWMCVALGCFLITMRRPFLFLGESERYLEYATFPSLFLLVKFLPEKYGVLIGVFVAYSIVYALLAVQQYQRQYRRKDENFPEDEAILKSLNRLPEGVLLPIGPFHYQALCSTRFPILTHGGNIDERLLSRDEFMLVYGNYPYPSERFLEIVERYKVKYIMSGREFLDHYRKNVLKDPKVFDQNVRILWETPTLVVGRIDI